MHRLPRRQLVYPFLELQYQEHAWEGERVEFTQPFVEDRLLPITGQPVGLHRPVE